MLVHCRLQSGTAGVNLSSFLRTSPSPIAIHVILLFCLSVLSVYLPVSMSVITSKREVSTQIGS